jgi:hypothetical protein
MLHPLPSVVTDLRTRNLLRGGWLTIAILGLLLGTVPVYADDDMRCGNRLISSGDTIDKVLTLCGEPRSREHRTIMRRPSYDYGGRIIYFGDGFVEVPVEIWTFNFGPNRLMRRIRFIDGEVDNIDTLDYGYNE